MNDILSAHEIDALLGAIGAEYEQPQKQHYSLEILSQSEIDSLIKRLYYELECRKEGDSMKVRPEDTVMQANDPVNHPAHYTSGKYEVIDIIEDQLGIEGLAGFCLGNTLKYICRAGKKGDEYKYTEDLEKAKWYLNHIIKRRKSLNG
jgi:hypothetical protein